MKKVIAIVAVLVMAFALVACSAAGSGAGGVKIGVILVHDENTGYDAAHIDGIKAGAKAAGIANSQIIWKYNIPEDESCYDTATDLVEQGCNYIFSDSYGHQDFMLQAATENPDVTFVSMTGDKAALSGLANYKNAFPHTFESRYVSGVVAGMKLKELMDAGKVDDPYVGYVGAFPYSEVVSGYTAFFLGVQSQVPEAHMDVIYTNSWYNPTAEAEAANALMSKGAHIISQHADSTGAPSAVETALKAGSVVYCVGYNIDMLKAAPTAALTSAQNNWSVYYTYAFKAAKAGEVIMTDWSEGYAAGANMISKLGPSCAAGTAEKVAEVEAAIKDGTLNIFDCSTYTVKGEHPTSFFATDTNGDWAGDVDEVIENGIFYESKLRSAPYFGMRIDGISELS